VCGLKKYRQHLLGRPTVIRIDHAALTYLMKTLEPIGNKDGGWTYSQKTKLRFSTAAGKPCHGHRANALENLIASSIDGRPRGPLKDLLPVLHHVEDGLRCQTLHGLSPDSSLLETRSSMRLEMPDPFEFAPH